MYKPDPRKKRKPKPGPKPFKKSSKRSSNSERSRSPRRSVHEFDNVSPSKRPPRKKKASGIRDRAQKAIQGLPKLARNITVTATPKGVCFSVTVPPRDAEFAALKLQEWLGLQ